VLTEAGPVDIEVPRDRDGSFAPTIVRKRQRRLDGVDEIVLSLTARGLATGDRGAPISAFAGFRFPPEVITLAVPWYLRFGLSSRDVEEAAGGAWYRRRSRDHHRWLQRFTPLLIDAARPCQHAPGDRWFVDET
jgi:Transposase, Mutator family